ncbi:hypothetical protein N7475_007150 [Penicillium sp. IBT 31633x]|nr:hypothetical protein N7475_007150 [Penicillium sp. IBT 31633x]
MIANAEVAPVSPLLCATKDEIDKVSSVNVGGMVKNYPKAARQMITQGDSEAGAGVKRYKILGAASIAGSRDFPACDTYSASKFAVPGLTQAMASEMYPPPQLY